MEVGVHDTRDIVLRTIRHEKLVGEQRKVLGVVDVVPVRDRCHYVHHKGEPNGYVGSGKPRAGQWAPEIWGDGGPVQSYAPNSEAFVARAYLLDQDRVGSEPTDPREWSQEWKEEARKGVISECTNEGYEEELGPRRAAFGPLLFLMQSPANSFKFGSQKARKRKTEIWTTNDYKDMSNVPE